MVKPRRNIEVRSIETPATPGTFMHRIVTEEKYAARGAGLLKKRVRWALKRELAGMRRRRESGRNASKITPKSGEKTP